MTARDIKPQEVLELEKPDDQCRSAGKPETTGWLRTFTKNLRRASLMPKRMATNEPTKPSLVSICRLRALHRTVGAQPIRFIHRPPDFAADQGTDQNANTRGQPVAATAAKLIAHNAANDCSGQRPCGFVWPICGNIAGV